MRIWLVVGESSHSSYLRTSLRSSQSSHLRQIDGMDDAADWVPKKQQSEGRMRIIVRV